MRRRDTALAVLVALIWGTNFVAIRSGLEKMGHHLKVSAKVGGA